MADVETKSNRRARASSFNAQGRCLAAWRERATVLKILDLLARLCAVLAGVLLTVISLMTCVSVIRRNTTSWTIVGDFELSASAAGAAIALFLPWCQRRRGNIVVDFFTARASASIAQGAACLWLPASLRGLIRGIGLQLLRDASKLPVATVSGPATRDNQQASEQGRCMLGSSARAGMAWSPLPSAAQRARGCPRGACRGFDPSDSFWKARSDGESSCRSPVRRRAHAG